MHKVMIFVALLVVVAVGSNPNIVSSTWSSEPVHEDRVSGVLYRATRAALEESARFIEPNEMAGWKQTLGYAQRADSKALFPCMSQRMCNRDEWYVDTIRYVATRTFESGSEEPIAKWIRTIRNDTDALSRCLKEDRDCLESFAQVEMTLGVHPEM